VPTGAPGIPVDLTVDQGSTGRRGRGLGGIGIGRGNDLPIRVRLQGQAMHPWSMILRELLGQLKQHGKLPCISCLFGTAPCIPFPIFGLGGVGRGGEGGGC
jgi:hypothetical protein